MSSEPRRPPFFLAMPAESGTFLRKIQRPPGEVKFGSLPLFNRRGAGLTCYGIACAFLF